jgi:TPR repeat protein
MGMTKRDAAGVIAVVVVVVGACSATQEGSTRPAQSLTNPTESALGTLSRRPDWLFPLAGCPADQFPGAEKAIADLGNACAADLQSCLDRCRSGEAAACYWGALRTQDLKVSVDYAEALFMRACRLGVPSGCTNRAAGIVMDVAETDPTWKCANRTFEVMCGQNDPWACTLWGYCLMRGLAVTRDLARAREVLPKSCRLGKDDSACAAARELLEEARTAR